MLENKDVLNHLDYDFGGYIKLLVGSELPDDELQKLAELAKRDYKTNEDDGKNLVGDIQKPIIDSSAISQESQDSIAQLTDELHDKLSEDELDNLSLLASGLNSLNQSLTNGIYREFEINNNLSKEETYRGFIDNIREVAESISGKGRHERNGTQIEEDDFRKFFAWIENLNEIIDENGILNESHYLVSNSELQEIEDDMKSVFSVINKMFDEPIRRS